MIFKGPSVEGADQEIFTAPVPARATDTDIGAPGGVPTTYVNDVGNVAVPPGVVTDTATVPEPAGSTAVTSVGLTTCTVVADPVPKWTALAVVRFEPSSATFVPPAVEPVVGVSEVMVGVDGMYVNPVGSVATPPWVRTVTVTGPRAWGGVTTVTMEAEVASTVAEDVPKVTVAPLRLVPVMVAVVPPSTGPELGVIEVIVGTGCPDEVGPPVIS